MLFPILLVEGTDDDTMARAGMDEFPVFQVDAYMGGPFLLSPVVEEDKVAFTELAFLYFPAIFLPLVVGVSFQILVIHLFIYRRGQSRAIDSSSSGSASTIGNSQPTGWFHIQGMIVLLVDVDAQTDGSLRQFLIIVSGGDGTATSQDEWEED